MDLFIPVDIKYFGCGDGGDLEVVPVASKKLKKKRLVSKAVIKSAIRKRKIVGDKDNEKVLKRFAVNSGGSGALRKLGMLKKRRKIIIPKESRKSRQIKIEKLINQPTDKLFEKLQRKSKFKKKKKVCFKIDNEYFNNDVDWEPDTEGPEPSPGRHREEQKVEIIEPSVIQETKVELFEMQRASKTVTTQQRLADEQEIKPIFKKLKTSNGNRKKMRKKVVTDKGSISKQTEAGRPDEKEEYSNASPERSKEKINATEQKYSKVKKRLRGEGPPTRNKKEDQTQCTSCKGWYASSYLPIHLTLHTNPHISKIVDCPVCLKPFPVKRQMWYHFCTHHLEGDKLKIFDPVLAHGVAIPQQRLTNHPVPAPQKRWNPEQQKMEVETNLNGFPCQVCGISLATRVTLNRHLKLKHGSLESQNKWSCEYCGKEFKGRDWLNYHIRKEHQGTIKSTCDHCGRELQTAGKLWRHLIDNHGVSASDAAAHCEVAFTPCLYCGEDLLEGRQYRNHVKLQHPEKHEEFMIVERTRSSGGPTYSRNPPPPEFMQDRKYQKREERRLMREHGIGPAWLRRELMDTGTCPECQKDFKGLALHRFREHGVPDESLARCGIDGCQAVFRNALILRGHVRSCHKTNLQEKIVKMKVVKVLEKSAVGEVLQCTLCNKYLYHLVEVKVHMLAVHQNLLEESLAKASSLRETEGEDGAEEDEEDLEAEGWLTLPESKKGNRTKRKRTVNSKRGAVKRKSGRKGNADGDTDSELEDGSVLGGMGEATSKKPRRGSKRPVKSTKRGGGGGRSGGSRAKAVKNEVPSFHATTRSLRKKRRQNYTLDSDEEDKACYYKDNSLDDLKMYTAKARRDRVAKRQESVKFQDVKLTRDQIEKDKKLVIKLVRLSEQELERHLVKNKVVVKVELEH